MTRSGIGASPHYAALPSASTESSADEHEFTLVIPCFNEQSRLPRTLEQVRVVLDRWNLDYRVLVVDDGSTDRTAEIAAQYGPRVSVLRLPQNRGKGAAVRAGFLAAQGKIVAFTDADLPYDPASLRRGFELICRDGVDAAFGSRVLADAQRRVRSPLLRRIAGGAFRMLVRRLATSAVTDTQCGLKIFRRESARQIFSRTRIDGFAFDVEVVYLAHRLGLTWIEVPVTLVNEGESTVSLRRHGPRMLRDVLALAARDWWRGVPDPVPAPHVVAAAAVSERVGA